MLFRVDVGRVGPVALRPHTYTRFARQVYLSKAREGLRDAHPLISAPTESRCLRYILEQNLASSALAETSSEEHVWFSETDRLLQSLVRGDQGRRPGHGQMVVMRVYGVDAQRSMQRCLRQAVKKLELHEGSPTHPLFSVMFDNGRDNTNLSKHIEPYFLEEFNLLASEDGGKPFTLTDKQEELAGRHTKSPTASLSYAADRSVKCANATHISRQR